MASSLTAKSTYLLKSGYRIPVIGYGVYQIRANEAEDLVDHAIRTGYRHVDSAASYRNEAPSATGMLKSNLKREDLFFTSKVATRRMSYESAVKDINETLRQTGLEYIDMYLIHAPYGGREARLGAWKALVEAHKEGKVRSIGVSNYGLHHLEELEGWIRETEAREGEGKGGVISVNQVELHPWLMRPEIVDWCRVRGVLLQAFSPLVRGERFHEEQLVEVGKRYGKTPAQVLIRWSLQKGFIPLPKSETKSRITENLDVFDFALTDEDVASLDTDHYAPCTWDPTVSRD